MLYFLFWRLGKHTSQGRADAWAVSAAEVGVVFCSIVLITGPLWAKPVWGIWWTWDVRLTTTLVCWMIYVSYLMMRKFSESSQTATLAAALAVFGFLDVPIVYMSIRWWRTQHPAPVFASQGGGIDPANEACGHDELAGVPLPGRIAGMDALHAGPPPTTPLLPAHDRSVERERRCAHADRVERNPLMPTNLYIAYGITWADTRRLRALAVATLRRRKRKKRAKTRTRSSIVKVYGAIHYRRRSGRHQPAHRRGG